VEILGDVILRSPEAERGPVTLPDDARPILERARAHGVIEFTTAPGHTDLYIVRFPPHANDWEDPGALIRKYGDAGVDASTPGPVVESMG
jgi:hypothetical protein